MTTRTLSREEVISRLRLPIETVLFDQGICHLYAHALIDRTIRAGTTSLREEDLPLIERYFQLLTEGSDRGGAIRRIEAELGRGREVSTESRLIAFTPTPSAPSTGVPTSNFPPLGGPVPAVPTQAAPSPVSPTMPEQAPAAPGAASAVVAARPREIAADLRATLEDEVERAVAKARDRLRLELHETCTAIAADAERIGARQGIEIRARVDSATREAMEAIVSARDEAGERLSKAALSEVQSRIKGIASDAAATITGIRRFESDAVLASIREAGEVAARNAVEFFERKVSDGEDQFRARIEIEAGKRIDAAVEIATAEIRARSEAAVAEAAKAVSERGASTVQEILPAIREAGDAAARAASDEVARRAAVLESELRDVARNAESAIEKAARDSASSAAIAAEGIEAAVRVAVDAAVRDAVERIGESSRDVEDRVRALVAAEVIARIDASIDKSLLMARDRIEGQFLQTARDAIRSDVVGAEGRFAEKIDSEIARFEKRIHTCFDLAREVSAPAPPRNRIESFHALLSGFADLLWPLWSMIAGPGRVYAPRVPTPAVSENVVAFPSPNEKEKAA
jgi:hypothetical protein